MLTYHVQYIRNRSIREVLFPTKGYFLQQPLLQLFSSVAFVEAIALSSQQPAPQDFAISAQQSAFESAVDFEVVVKFEPIAIPSPTTHNNTNVAANFILTSFTYCLANTVYAEAFKLLAF